MGAPRVTSEHAHRVFHVVVDPVRPQVSAGSSRGDSNAHCPGFEAGDSFRLVYDWMVPREGFEPTLPGF